YAVGVRRGHLIRATRGQIGRARDAWRVSVLDGDGLDAGGVVATLIGRLVSAADDKLPGAIARTNRVPLPTDCHRPTAVVARRYAVGVRGGHLAGAAHGQAGRAGDAR